MRARIFAEENRKWLTLAAVSVGLFMIMLDNTVVNVALPSIQRDLDADLSELQWIVTGYALTFAALMLVGGKVADAFGRRLIFVIGIAVFTIASLLCGLASSGEMLIAARVLQGAGARISKTEFVACPSCGRTLFDLQTTTQRIREKTGHLKGVKLAIMGCIVNGPGEMADADFGYVGGAPGKINLYAGRNCVQYNIPQADADARLIALIKEHGKWTDPEPAPG